MTPPRYLDIRAAAPARLDAALAAGGMSRRQARRYLDEKRVLVNGQPIGVASRMLKGGDRIVVVLDDVALPVLRERSEYLAIDKPSGVASQPGREPGAPSAIELAALDLKRRGEEASLFLVHRIDSGTSGVLVFARNTGMARQLSSAFAGREVTKSYLAVVHGVVEAPFVVDSPIARAGETTFAVDDDGKPAESRVIPLAAGEGVSLVEVSISTGRTHQIRVHLAERGFPVVGDLRYGAGSPLDREAGRLLLHAWKLSHRLVGELTAPLPESFVAAAVKFGLALSAFPS